MSANPALMLDELEHLPARSAPTMGNVAKVSYTHLDMIDFMLCNPGCTLADLARRYGYSVGWICNVQASDAWKSAFAKRRGDMTDAVVEQNVKERLEGITILSLERLKQKLEAPMVSDNVVLRAVELGAKAMGVGGNAPTQQTPAADHLAQLANRLIDLQSKVRGRTLEGEVSQPAFLAGGLEAPQNQPQGV